MRVQQISRALIRAAVISICILGIPYGAAAQATTGTQPGATFSPMPPEAEGITITPFLGPASAGDLASTPVTFGGAVGYGANERISLEGELAFSPNASQGELVELDASVWSLSGNVLYHFLRANSTPYATFGIGVVGSNPDTSGLAVDLDSTTGFAWNVGGGLKSALNDRFGLRGDIRYFNATNDAPDFWRVYGGLVIRRIGR